MTATRTLELKGSTFPVSPVRPPAGRQPEAIPATTVVRRAYPGMEHGSAAALHAFDNASTLCGRTFDPKATQVEWPAQVVSSA